VAFELIQNESDMRPVVLDGAGLDESFDPEIAFIRLVAHIAEFGDGDVVAFIGSIAGKGEPRDGAQDYGDRKADPHGIRGSLHVQIQRYERKVGGSMVWANKRDPYHI